MNFIHGLVFALCLLGALTTSRGQDSALMPARISCNAHYSAPCARTNSQWLATTMAARLDDVEEEVNFDQVLVGITQQLHNMNIGFYPFIIEKTTSICHAHGGNASFVNRTLDDIFSQMSIYSDTGALHQRFVAASEKGGDWVLYLWRDGGVSNSKLAFVVPVRDNYYLGVGYPETQLPVDVPCSVDYDSWCSIRNVQSLVGRAQFQLSKAVSLPNFEIALREISEDKAFHIDGGFDVFLYSYQGHQIQRSVNTTLWDIVADRGIGTVEDGLQLHDRFIAAAEGVGNGWVQYTWRDQLDEATYTKIALVVKTTFNGIEIYLGAGFRFAVNVVATGPLDTLCSEGSNQPCAFRTAMELSSHTFAHVVSSPHPADKMFLALSEDQDQFLIGEFYVFVYDFNQTCIHHGQNPHYAGMTLKEVSDENNITTLDANELHEQFRTTALRGGGWMLYDWVKEDSNFQKISYIFRMNIDGRDYYGGVGFHHKQYPVEINSDNGLQKNGLPVKCSMKYGRNSSCSEVNARSILGHGLAELILASSGARLPIAPRDPSITLDHVLQHINAKDGAFRVNDFFIMVFSFDKNKCSKDSVSGCCLAHGLNASLVGLTWQEILDQEDITKIRGESLHRLLMSASKHGGKSIEYSWSGELSKRAWTALFRDEGESYYVVAEYFETPQPPTCDNCPHDMKCTNADQSFCAEVPFGQDKIFLWMSLLCALCVLGSVTFVAERRRSRRKIARATKEIGSLHQQLKDLLVGVVVVDYAAPRCSPVWFFDTTCDLVESDGPPAVVVEPTFMPYQQVSIDQIEQAFQIYNEDMSYNVFRIHVALTGAEYEIDFDSMKQRNTKSGFERSVLRQFRVRDKEPRVLPELPEGITFTSRDPEALLPLVDGQVIQISKVHPNGEWFFGTVLYDPILNEEASYPLLPGPMVAQLDTVDTNTEELVAHAMYDDGHARITSGWFPRAETKPADVNVMQKLLDMLGGIGVDALRPPPEWDRSNSELLLDVTIGTNEHTAVSQSFLRHFPGRSITVVNVERVQNLPLWQSYAVKKQSVKARDARNPQYRVNNRDPYDVERRWLFHGSTFDNIHKIIQQGFNPAFAGRNGVDFGAGVYFAKDASYSSGFAVPHNGVHRMLLCRVVVGDWCRGRPNQMTPDPKPHNSWELFDTTVDDVDSPSIFVVYKDAQTYPDYLVSFTRS